jgi:hypothetical protein
VICTLSPAAGRRFSRQVAGSDQFPLMAEWTAKAIGLSSAALAVNVQAVNPIASANHVLM